MAIWSGLGGIGTAVTATAATAVVVVGGVVGYQILSPSEDVPQDGPVVTAPQAPGGDLGADVASNAVGGAQDGGQSGGNVATAPADAGVSESAQLSQDLAPAIVQDEVATLPNPPSFDLVRVDRDGNALVAGRAEPGSNVRILLDGSEVGRSGADPDGSFATIFTVPAAEQPRTVALLMEIEGQEPVRSNATVIIQPTPQVVASSTAPDAGAAPEPVIADAPQAPLADTPDVIAALPEAPDAPTVPVIDAPEVPEVVVADAPDAAPIEAPAPEIADASGVQAPVAIQPPDSVSAQAPEAPGVAPLDLALLETPPLAPLAPNVGTGVNLPPDPGLTLSTSGSEIPAAPGEPADRPIAQEQVDRTEGQGAAPGSVVIAAPATDPVIDAAPAAPVASLGTDDAPVVAEGPAPLADRTAPETTDVTVAAIAPDTAQPAPLVVTPQVDGTPSLPAAPVVATKDAPDPAAPSGAPADRPNAALAVASETRENTTGPAVQPPALAADTPRPAPEIAGATPNPAPELPFVAPPAPQVAIASPEPAVDAPRLTAPAVQDTSNVALGLGPEVTANLETALALLSPERAAPRPPKPEQDAPVVAPGRPVDRSPQAPEVLLADDTGIRVLQSGGGQPQIQSVVIDTITYDPSGDVSLGGRGTRAEGFVRVYLDNTPILTTEIGVDGQWRTPLPQVDTGVYTLRVDQIDQEGAVVSRVETPFKREEPDVIAALDLRALGDRSDVGVITVQPGNTLWGIATEKYGDGMLFVRVFQANKERIRDPDLIYPGQVFAIPD